MASKDHWLSYDGRLPLLDSLTFGAPYGAFALVNFFTQPRNAASGLRGCALPFIYAR
jgi:hypothetical protein